MDGEVVLDPAELSSARFTLVVAFWTVLSLGLFVAGFNLALGIQHVWFVQACRGSTYHGRSRGAPH